MNKEVIYIEPEDDITDIITKIEKSKEKIIALVPPKKAGVFRSVVNIKLIAKASAAAEKTTVIVTTDPSITKLAATTKVPVTKDLKTAPTIPEVEDEIEVTVSEEIVEENNEDKNGEPSEDGKDDEAGEDDTEDGDEDADDDDSVEDAEPKKKDTKAGKKLKDAGGKIAKKIKLRRKLIIFGVLGTILLILALVWAFVVAPAADVTVEIKTTLNNFSENISFTQIITEEKADEGKFYLEETKIENVVEKTFEATGTKNVGEKATGSVVVYASVNHKGGVVVVNAGDIFTNDGLSFVANSGVRLEFDGDDTSVCANEDVSAKEFREQGCRIYRRVEVTATAAGTSYNISARDSGWNTAAPVGVYSDSAMAGGTDKTITVVQQSDIDKAVSEIETSSEESQKEALLAKVKPDALVISSSFTATTSDPVATPAVGEEVGEGVKPSVKVTTTTSVFSIDETKVKEFIAKKAHIDEGQKIYTIKDPFIDNFVKTDDGYTGKLKTSYSYGPEISETSVVEVVKGKGIGEATHDLKDINGVSSVNIKPSFPWVTFVPGDQNKITVNIEVKE